MEITYEEKLKQEWENYKRNKKNEVFPTILIAGASGVGKSSLINKIFGDRYAAISDVRPETQGFHIYHGKKHNCKVNLIDSAGYETNQADTYYSAMARVLREGLDGKQIHVVWYCISVANRRIEDFDVDVLSNILCEENIRGRLCIVFTKCDYDSEDSKIANEFRNVIKAELSNRNAPTRDLNFYETSGSCDLELQINDLIAWSANAIDDRDIRRCFISAQKYNLNMKKEEAAIIINLAVVAAAGIGAVPIPFSDATLLTAAQVKMVSSILDVYELSNYTSMSEKIIGNVVIGNLGKAIAGSLLKMIPGVGSFLGALINGTVASALTFALGSAISEICYHFTQDALDGMVGDVNKLFDSNNIMALMESYKK